MIYGVNNFKIGSLNEGFITFTPKEVREYLVWKRYVPNRLKNMYDTFEYAWREETGSDEPIVIKTKRVSPRVYETKRGYSQEYRAAKNKLIESAPFCSECGTGKMLTCHHLDHDKENNSLDNLQVLCWGCHSKLHKHMRNTPPSFFKFRDAGECSVA